MVEGRALRERVKISSQQRSREASHLVEEEAAVAAVAEEEAEAVLVVVEPEARQLQQEAGSMRQQRQPQALRVSRWKRSHLRSSQSNYRRKSGPKLRWKK